MRGLETWPKHNATHYLCCGWFMQKYGAIFHVCIVFASNQPMKILFGQLFPLCMKAKSNIQLLVVYAKIQQAHDEIRYRFLHKPGQ